MCYRHDNQLRVSTCPVRCTCLTLQASGEVNCGAEFLQFCICFLSNFNSFISF